MSNTVPVDLFLRIDPADDVHVSLDHRHDISWIEFNISINKEQMGVILILHEVMRQSISTALNKTFVEHGRVAHVHTVLLQRMSQGDQGLGVVTRTHSTVHRSCHKDVG